ncbi:helix-hairpin-helix domain-containing protein [Fibrobacter sp. UWB10]|uniref:ComEA family DNA-binding protein n=1 Tax=Fibrobacter sp. UWB10 TaxID=1896201 RepID=UPI00240342D0|nr:helix-hairpin-helix domain-containing protein [Fibrobacter sp. UWB10]SMP46734.1 competence protein ComEA [Fibrobacter sp. UWB10]
MNAPEKNVVRLALCLLVIGIIVRVLPWGLPSIETFEVGESFIVGNDTPLTVARDSIATNDSLVSKFDNNFESKPKKERKSVKKVTLPVHINSASIDELCALNGVGPKLAEKILEAKNAFGPFKTGEDLQKVPGIGKKKLEKLLPGVIFD